jgi:NitT/TauT family transport system substrate-binding protein
MLYGEVAPGAGRWPRYVGVEKGYFTGEGLDVDVTIVGSGATTVQQVVAGALDIGATDFATVIYAVENGAPLVAVGSPMLKYAFTMMSDPSIRAASDLRGKRALTSFLKDPNNIFFEQWLRLNDVDPTEVDTSFEGNVSNRYTALASGIVQAAALSAPFDLRAAAEGYNKLVDFGTLAGDNYAFAALYARRPWLQQNGDAVRAFLRAYAHSIDWLLLHENRDEAIDILTRATQLDRAYAAATYDYYIGELKPFSHNLAIPDSALQGTLDTIVATGDMQPPTPPLSRYFDPSYLPR